MEAVLVGAIRAYTAPLTCNSHWKARTGAMLIGTSWTPDDRRTAGCSEYDDHCSTWRGTGIHERASRVVSPLERVGQRTAPRQMAGLPRGQHSSSCMSCP
eukprot:365586-Chlamydomonas_euryale.AAC.4